MRVCVCIYVFHTGPVCTCECVCVCGRRYSMSAAGSTQAAAAAKRERERERENEREETPAQEREAKRGTSTGSLCTGPELLQSESPYRKKAGSSQQRSGLAQTDMHTPWNMHTHTHTVEQNNTRASVSAQRSSSGSRACLDLQLCAKNNKEQDNVGADMQHSPSAFYVCRISLFTRTDTPFVRYCR